MSVQTRTLQITGLRFETLAALGEKASDLGKSVEDYVRELLEDNVEFGEMKSDATLAPFRQQVAESGITDEELDELFVEARHDYHRERQEGT